MKLIIDNLSFSYDSEDIISNVSFQIETGKIIGLIGANGAGKTTIIKNIMGFLKPNKGKIVIDDKNIAYNDHSTFPLAYIPDSPSLYEYLSVEEHLDFLGSLYKINKKEIEDLASYYGLVQYKNKTPYQLSKGNKQKLMICCSLLKPYNFLIADEPFEALDPEQISNFKNHLNKLKSKGKGIIISTHLLNMVEDICDEYVIIHRGIVIASGDVSKIKKHFNITADNIEEIYLTILNRLKDKED